jgi:hypothetical protein
MMVDGEIPDGSHPTDPSPSIYAEDHAPAPIAGPRGGRASSIASGRATWSTTVNDQRVDVATASWEALAGDETFMREVVRLLITGKSYSAIADKFRIARSSMLMIAARVPNYIAEETRLLAMVWQGAEFARLESVKAGLLPFIDVANEQREEDDDTPTRAPSDKLLNAYARLVSVEMALLTLGGRQMNLPEVPGIADTDGSAKAQLVVRYRELIEKMYVGVIESGYGAGAKGDDTDDDDEDDEFLLRRADNSDTIDDAVVLDSAPFTDTDLDSSPGEWHDGKFYPLEATGP